jgi:transglutaminase-like putative cysteine protease
LLVLPLRADQRLPVKPTPRATLELWDAVYLDGAKAGYRRTTIEETKRDGQTVFVTTQLMQLTVKRYKSVVTQRMAMSTEETAQGKVVGVSVTQYLDRGEATQRGRVEDGKLIVTTPTDPDGKALPWNDKVIGLYGQETLFRRHKVKPGDKFHFLDYQLALLRPVPVQVEVKDREEIEVLEVVKGEKAKAKSVKKSLLRVEMMPEKITLGQNTIQLPRMTAWLDNNLRVVRSQSAIPGLADLMAMYRTTREVAEKGAAPEQMKDLGLKSFVRLDRVLARPGQAREIVYRFTAKDDDDPKSLFARDSRQSVENVEGHTFDLRVRAIREPEEGKKSTPPGKEYLESSYFLDSGNEKVQATVAKIVGDEDNAWRKAQRIEKWVNDHMTPSNDASPCPASEILHTRKGDCRQHAMLMAALCRAAHIPARTAMGLVYALDEGSPILAFHMWTEVWINEQWLMLDAMQAAGSVGPTHLKIVDHSWRDIQTLAPLLPALRVIGKVKAEVVSVK